MTAIDSRINSTLDAVAVSLVTSTTLEEMEAIKKDGCQPLTSVFKDDDHQTAHETINNKKKDRPTAVGRTRMATKADTDTVRHCGNEKPGRPNDAIRDDDGTHVWV